MATISGEIRDENDDLLADCVVRAYRRDTGALLVAGLSGDGSEEVPGDADYASVSLLLHCDGTDGSTTFTDNSPTPKTITVYGNAHIETDQSKFGGASAYFDGTGDYLTAPASAAFNFGSGNFTLEFFIKTAGTLQYMCPLGKNSGTFGDGAITILLNHSGSGAASLWVEDYNAGAPLLASATSAAINDNAWHHFAVVRNGSAWAMYKDGTSIATATWAGAISDASYLYAIGTDPGNLTRYLTGYLDDIRITKGVARYTANFTPPDAAFLDYAVIPAKPLGEYALTTSYTGEVQVIALDPAGGTTFNDLILRTTPV
ncbi:MAG: LamG domain-containing protein [Chromatiaceae bacterium]|nr:LamG domain-containing protein [Chromatiaceae bacterium]